MKYLALVLFTIVAVSVIESAPRPPFENYDDARNALGTAIKELKTIAKNMPANNPDHTKVEQTASFLFVLSQSMNEQNFKFINYSHHYKQGIQLIEKYKEYLA